MHPIKLSRDEKDAVCTLICAPSLLSLSAIWNLLVKVAAELRVQEIPERICLLMTQDGMGQWSFDLMGMHKIVDRADGLDALGDEWQDDAAETSGPAA